MMWRSGTEEGNGVLAIERRFIENSARPCLRSFDGKQRAVTRVLFSGDLFRRARRRPAVLNLLNQLNLLNLLNSLNSLKLLRDLSLEFRPIDAAAGEIVEPNRQ